MAYSQIQPFIYDPESDPEAETEREQQLQRLAPSGARTRVSGMGGGHTNKEVNIATRSNLYPDQVVSAVTRIQYVYSPDGGSGPREDLYSPESQRRPGQLDKP